MHTVFFVLNDIKISLAEDLNTFSIDCKPNHDGASRPTISSAYASKLKSVTLLASKVTGGKLKR